MLAAMIVLLHVVLAFLQHTWEVVAAVPFVMFGVTFPKGNQGLLYVSEDWDGTEAGADTATWIILDGIEAFDRESRATKNDHFFFGRTQAVTAIGIPARGVTLAGQYAQDDAGQDLLRAYGPDGANANDNLGFMWLRDGSDGFAQFVQVGGTPESARAEGDLEPVSFELAPQDEAVSITGYGSS